METLETSGGNTITPEVLLKEPENSDMETNSKSRQVPSKYWVLTAYGDEIALLKDVVPLHACLYVLGDEVCPKTKRSHLQGYLEFKEKVRPKELFETKITHWEHRKGNQDQNFNYCTKEGKFITNMKNKVRKPIKDPMDGLEMYQWQKDIKDIIHGEPHPRKVYWYWEPIGCTGKSTFTKHLCMKENAYVVSGKGADIKFALKTELETRDVPIVIYDIPRVYQNQVGYASIEEIKNGCMFSGKFESGMCLFNIPHVIVFSNCEPDFDCLSSDRWEVREVRI